MCQLDNQSQWSAGLYPGWSRTGKRQFTLVVKAGFGFDVQGNLTVLPQPPIEEADRYRGDPKTSSLEAACEIVPFKKGGELLLFGTAHPMGKGTVGEVEVGIHFADGRAWRKTLRVFGRRQWRSILLMALPGAPEPLEAIALTYENAYGGCDQGDPEKPFAANPSGKGYTLRGLRLKNLELPRIEMGPPFITSPTSRPAPAGYGPISPLWAPRLSAFESARRHEAREGGCPWGEKTPGDLFNAAPLDQRFAATFQGDETISLKGFFPEAPQGLQLRIPPIQPEIDLETDEGNCRVEIRCDTLVIDTDRKQLHLLWRGAITGVEDDDLITVADAGGQEARA